MPDDVVMQKLASIDLVTSRISVANFQRRPDVRDSGTAHPSLHSAWTALRQPHR